MTDDIKTKTYLVRIPVSGSITVTVVATNEREASEKAFDLADFRVQLLNPNDAECSEFEMHNRTCYGNVCNLSCRAIEIEELQGIDE